MVTRPLLIWSVSMLVLLPLAVVGLRITPAYKPTGEYEGLFGDADNEGPRLIALCKNCPDDDQKDDDADDYVEHA